MLARPGIDASDLGASAHVQMAHVDALGDELQDSGVRQLGAASQLNVPQLRTPPADGLQSSVRESSTSVEEDSFHGRAKRRRGPSEDSGDALKDRKKIRIGSKGHRHFSVTLRARSAGKLSPERTMVVQS